VRAGLGRIIVGRAIVAGVVATSRRSSCIGGIPVDRGWIARGSWVLARSSIRRRGDVAIRWRPGPAYGSVTERSSMRTRAPSQAARERRIWPELCGSSDGYGLTADARRRPLS